MQVTEEMKAMANQQKKMVEAITSMDVDFAQWYTDVVKKAELVDYSGVRGCMVIRPYGYALWENIQQDLDARFKETGHENVYMPMFIPESLLQKEKDHVEGFAPEVAWVTHGGSEKLTERLCVRPTSETMFCDHYAHVIQSYRDLPKLYNQWCSVVRWEKTTRPFLRTMEFLWQEGHTMHETAEEALAETERMLNVYADFCEQSLAIPVVKGRKTKKEQFAGAEATYTIEALMHDGKALQSGTSHYFGDGFARAFDITFTGRDNTLQHPFQTSWGMSTRIIGAIIMTHGDDNGLVMPPAVAPIQVVIVPIAQHKEGVLDKAKELEARLRKICRVRTDSSDQSPGWKFAEYEMKGVPLRLEIGPKDIEKNQCVLVRRDNREKIFVPLDELETKIPELLQAVHDGMYQKALERRESMTYAVTGGMDEMIEAANTRPGFIKAAWCGELECEERLKEEAGVSSRCMPFEQEHVSDTCVCCGKPAKTTVIWGKAY
jgi:prolyl-tRNA synthetase